MGIGFDTLPSVSAQGEFEGARIPVFSSLPSKLNAAQEASKRYIYSRLRAFGLDPRTVGGSDTAIVNPLHEVRTVARHCAGGIILGYKQITAARAVRHVTRKLDDDGTVEVTTETIRNYAAPTPWNQLETGILFGLGLPLFILKEGGVSGGVFDEGSADVLVHSMPMPPRKWAFADGWEAAISDPRDQRSFDEALLRWQGLVRSQYYGA